MPTSATPPTPTPTINEWLILSVFTPPPPHRGLPCYAAEIAAAVGGLTNGRRRLPSAGWHTTLRRMERKGWVVGAWGRSASGARRRYYRATPAGKRIQRTTARWLRDALAALSTP